jgi:hypothetical protein
MCPWKYNRLTNVGTYNKLNKEILLQFVNNLKNELTKTNYTLFLHSI